MGNDSVEVPGFEFTSSTLTFPVTVEGMINISQAIAQISSKKLCHQQTDSTRMTILIILLGQRSWIVPKASDIVTRLQSFLANMCDAETLKVDS